MEQANTCPICGQTYSSALCPRCGFENRLMLVSEPNPIIQQIDEQRIEIAKRNWDFAIKLQEEIESLTKENQNVQSKITELHQTIEGLNSQINKLSSVDDEDKRLRRDLVEQQQKMAAVTAERDKLQNEKSQLNKKQKELEDRMNDLAVHLSSAQYEISLLNSQLEEKQKQISQGQNTISDLTKQRDDYKEQLSKMTKEKDVVDSQYRKLFEQMSSMQYEVSNLKSELQIQTEEKERLESLLSEQQTNQKSTSNPSGSTTSTNVNRGERKGEVEFFNGHSKVREDIFLGKNSYVIPQSMHSHLKGEVFMINENNNCFTIFDCCGLLKKANGRDVPNKGEQLFEGENVFTISNIVVKVVFPEIDLKNINF